MGSFCDYYNGVKTAPVLTVFIGGNHEASNLLTEYFHGGFLGTATTITITITIIN